MHQILLAVGTTIAAAVGKHDPNRPALNLKEGEDGLHGLGYKIALQCFMGFPCRGGPFHFLTQMF